VTQVLEQQIDVTLPSDEHKKMLIVQPHLEFLEPVQEPFPLSRYVINGYWM